MTPELTIEGPRFRLRLWTPAPSVVCSEASGHLTVDAVMPMVERFENEAVLLPEPLRISVFHDFSGVSGFDSAARVQFTEASKKMMHRAGTITYLTSSTLMTMAVSVANVIFGNLRATTDPALFAAERDSAIAASMSASKRPS